MREIALEVPSVRWADVGGLDEIKEKLKQSVLWPQEKAQDLRAMGITVCLPQVLFSSDPPKAKLSCIEKMLIVKKACLKFRACMQLCSSIELLEGMGFCMMLGLEVL